MLVYHFSGLKLLVIVSFSLQRVNYPELCIHCLSNGILQLNIIFSCLQTLQSHKSKQTIIQAISHNQCVASYRSNFSPPATTNHIFALCATRFSLVKPSKQGQILQVILPTGSRGLNKYLHQRLHCILTTNYMISSTSLHILALVSSTHSQPIHLGGKNSSVLLA